MNTGRQLVRLAERDIFKNPLPSEQTSIADPYDSQYDIDDRARSYLHVNCTHCHTRGGGGTAVFQTRIEFSLDETKLVNGVPTQGDMGILDPFLIAPGDPHRSVLYHRLAKLGPGHMPQFGSNAVDERGLNLISSWITDLVQDDSIPTAVSNAEALRAFESGKASTIDTLLAKPETALLLADAITGEDLEQEHVRGALDKASEHENAFVATCLCVFRISP